MADMTEEIKEALKNPKAVASDGTQVTQHSLKEMIEVDQYLANQEAAKSRKLPVRFFNTRPPGAV